MTFYSQILRATNCIHQEGQTGVDLYYKVTDLSRNLPLTLFEGSRKKDDFYKALREADELINLIDTFKYTVDDSKSSQIRFSIKRLNNILLLSISYHCRTIFNNFSQLSAIHSNNAHQNSIRESEIETGYLVMKDMTNTLLSVYQQFNVPEVNFLTREDQEEMLGLLLQSIILLNALRIQNPEASEHLDNPSEKWTRRCWNELGLPLMKLSLSIMETNGSDATGCTSKYQALMLYRSSALKSLKYRSHEDVETRSTRETLLFYLKQTLSANTFEEIGNQLDEVHVFKHATPRKRRTCDRTISYVESDHSYLDIYSILEQFYGFTFPTINMFWTNNGDDNGIEGLEDSLMEMKSKDQTQDLISMLLRRILTSYHPSNVELNDCLAHPGIATRSREAARILLPIFYVLLTKAHVSMIPREDLISICKTLMVSAHDNEVVNLTTEMISRVLARIAQTNSECSAAGIYDFVGLIDCISNVLSVHPSPSFHILENMLSSFRLLAITYSHDEHLWLLLTRQPHVFSAIVRATAWQSLHVPVIQILWTLSNNPGNQRSVARHPGILAAMIRIARENPMEEESSALEPNGITMEMWKGRIMKLANAL